MAWAGSAAPAAQAASRPLVSAARDLPSRSQGGYRGGSSDSSSEAAARSPRRKVRSEPVCMSIVRRAKSTYQWSFKLLRSDLWFSFCPPAQVVMGAGDGTCPSGATIGERPHSPRSRVRGEPVGMRIVRGAKRTPR